MACGIIPLHQLARSGQPCHDGVETPLAQALVASGLKRLHRAQENAGMKIILSFGFAMKQT